MNNGKYTDWVTEEQLILIEGWARDGLTNEQIAHNMGISVATFYNWKNKYVEILEAVKRGKEVIDIQVENALLKRALGYRYEEVTHESGWDPIAGGSTLKVAKVVTKEVHPDTTAQIFWLKNRKPQEWRDKRDVEHSGSVTQKNIDISNLSDEEIQKELKKYDR